MKTKLLGNLVLNQIKMELDHERLHQHHLPSSEDQVKVGVAITLLQSKKKKQFKISIILIGFSTDLYLGNEHVEILYSEFEKKMII